MNANVLPAITLLACALLAAPVALGAEEGVFRFDSLNRRYTDLAPDLVPVKTGPVTVWLSSPEHELNLVGNRLVLEPRPDGGYDAVLELEFSGRGQLVADFDVSGTRSRLEDDLTVPRQTRSLAARVRIRKSPEGYLVTPETLPETFEVAIQSRVGAQLVAACAPLSLLGLAPIDCNALARSFATAAIPMPPAGETYLLEADRLSEADRERLDAFLARSARPAR